MPTGMAELSGIAEDGAHLPLAGATNDHTGELPAEMYSFEQATING